MDLRQYANRHRPQKRSNCRRYDDVYYMLVPRTRIVKTTLKQIFRWLAVVPGALLGAIIVMFPVHWVAMYIHHFGTSDPMITDEQGRGLLQSMPLESLERFGDALF